MAQCETCGNDYDKAFQVIKDGLTHTFDSSSVRSMRWLHNAPCVGYALWGMALKRAAGSTAATTAPRGWGLRDWPTGRDPHGAMFGHQIST